MRRTFLTFCPSRGERCRPARAIALRKQRGFREVRDETARAGDAEGRAAGFCADHLAHQHDAVPVEDEHRHDGFLDRRSSRPRIIPCRITRVPGTRTGRDNYGGYDTPDPSARRNYIPVRFVPRQNPFYCRPALQRRDARPIQAGSASGHSLVQAGLHRGRDNPFARVAGSRFARATGSATRNGKIAALSAPIISNTFSKTNVRSRT